jgi:periplasmic copper chaperone A
VLVVSACGDTGDPDLEVGTARASERLGGASQVVVEVTNHGDGDDTMVDATTPAATGTEIHLTTIDDDGRATMDTIDDVEIPAGETVHFRPGGLHLMLTVPDESVVAGGTFELTLVFDRSGDLTVPVQVVENHELLEPDA